ncbi:Uncharacterised protein [Acinetobacter nosocomialis]|uniref:hypothetical protein n=1 Tax=Acinetobacter nosocomialis TaxID=106654 RepID=UPI000DE601F3|nr:hypothetical protein [Acinetobacter nosocomialis]MBR7693925.1 hypothetical protein [Acinetobacter nosocomialis]MDE3320750.1 hypothetical protein [Acinetobacter nosocomialis]SSO21411.1 Uncharacterised protein [Acinetobacter nosocomialis]SSQ79907.1 Uncharacterised protein [Acinetobacter nosocomialis]HCT5801660.1 hypothetical protein [Acinetobacter nosocomialis]
MSDPRPRCPYCNSKQTRFTPSKSNILKARFSCKSCGGSFTIDTDVAETKGGCLKSLFKLTFWVIIAAIGFAIYIAKFDTSPKKSSSTNQSSIEKKSETNNKEEFSPEAEKAAHDYIPTDEDYKKLEQTQKVQKSDNLTIVETTRESK